MLLVQAAVLAMLINRASSRTHPQLSRPRGAAVGNIGADVSGLLIAALTASTHTPIGRGSEDLGCKHLPFDGSQRSCCWLADAAAIAMSTGSRPDVDAAASCSNLSDCMSLSARRHLLGALCWLACSSGQTSGAAARSKAKLMQGC